MLPPEVQALCSHYLEQVLNHPHHHLSSKGRIEIYQAFGESARPDKGKARREEQKNAKDGYLIFTQAGRTLGYLGLLTAEKVVPVWQRARKQPNGAENEELYGNPVIAIEVGKRILQGSEAIQSALDIAAYYGSNTFNFENPTKYDLEFAFAMGAASEALEAITSGLSFMIIAGSPVYEDEQRDIAPHDFASKAIIAYAGFEEDHPEEKRLEFWQWWLTEAVPQAWELAQQA